MQYTYPVEEYVRRLREYNELETMSFSPDDDREYIIGKLEERSAKKRVIADIANTMVREYVETFEGDPGALTEEDAEKLEAFEEALFPSGASVGSVGATDYGIYYRIAKILKDHYKGLGDTNRYASALNRCSLGHMCLINGHSFSVQNARYFDECVELVKLMENGELDGEAKKRVLIMLSREAITSEDRFPAERFRFVFDTLRSHMKDLDARSGNFIMYFFCTTILQLFREHAIWAKDRGEPFDAESVRPLISDVVAALREQIGEDPDPTAYGDGVAFLLVTDFLLGDVTLDGLLDGLTELQRIASENPNPSKQAQGLGMFNYYYLNILYRFSPLPRDEIVRLSRERIKEVMPKLMSVTRQVNNVSFNRYIVEFLNAASLTGSFDEFAEIILGSTVYADKALFIHTAMVREMSLSIFDRMIADAPEFFDGVAGRDAEYIMAHPDEMRKLLSECCLFHDIGKFFMLDVVENSMRRLTDDEFGIIKDHPGHFGHIYQVIDEGDERVLCIRDCALTHHLWHDGSRGYPNVPQTKNRPFSDILAIADSIDAATDFLGRPYNSGKTIDQLIAEFQAGAGDRYGPEAAAALSAPEVRDKLDYLITEGRRDIYYRIYAFNKL